MKPVFAICLMLCGAGAYSVAGAQERNATLGAAVDNAAESAPRSDGVPILRPLLPTAAHLAAAVCSNSLLVTDTFVKVKLVEKLVSALDVGSPYAMRGCEGENAHAPAHP